MQNLAQNNRSGPLRVFRVGVVGASISEMDTILRVFSVTQYRTRRYEAVRLPHTLSCIPGEIDIVLLAQNNTELPRYYEGRRGGERVRKPIVAMVRHALPGSDLSGYTLKTPLNPAKFLRMLDNYTIKELNYFPEFEIGREGVEMKGDTLNALRMLKTEPSPSQAISRRSGPRALVVDDSLAVRKQMQIEFELLNQGVDLVDSAEAAMQAISVIRYRIIFLDVVMPGMDGYAACKNIRRSALNKSTPIVMLTGRSSSFDKFKGTLAGCDAYLVKPINHNDFENIFRKFTSVKQGAKADGHQ